MTIPSWARPGVKVVCLITLDESWEDVADGDAMSGPVRAEVCEITCVCPDSRMDAGFCVSLADYDGVYDGGAFRPLVTKTQEQDVAMFARLVTAMPAPERVERIAEDLDASWRR